MRRLLLPLLLLTLSLPGCDTAPTTAPSDQPTGPQVQAEAFPSKLVLPIEPYSQFVSCANGGAGEVITFSGTIYVTSTVVYGGDTYHESVQYRTVIIGVGAESGKVYRGTNVYNSTFIDLPGFFGLVWTTTVSGPTSGRGPQSTFLVHYRLHYTELPSGSTAVFFEDLSEECR